MLHAAAEHHSQRSGALLYVYIYHSELLEGSLAVGWLTWLNPKFEKPCRGLPSRKVRDSHCHPDPWLNLHESFGTPMSPRLDLDGFPHGRHADANSLCNLPPCARSSSTSSLRNAARDRPIGFPLLVPCIRARSSPARTSDIRTLSCLAMFPWIAMTGSLKKPQESRYGSVKERSPL
jgi:hypothetical protein